MTCSGSIGRRLRCSRSWLGAWRQSRSSCSSPSASPAWLKNWAGCPSCGSRACRMAIPGSCSHRSSRLPSTTACASGSSPRHVAIPSRCSSCHVSSHRDDLPVVSGSPATGSLPGRIEASFRRRVEELPPETQRLLLVAAADPTGEPALLVRASEEIGVPIQELSPAEADGLLELGSQVAFRHPLLRSAIYRAASPEERQAAHQALAAATDAEARPRSPGLASRTRHRWARRGRRARAGAVGRRVPGPGADLQRPRAFLERSAALTPDPSSRAQRALEAAEPASIWPGRPRAR